MRRLVPYLLVLLQLVQSVAIPHSHAGTEVAEPADHAQRPHFHFGGFAALQRAPDRCSHGDRLLAPGNQSTAHEQLPPADHDCDAVYLTDGTVTDQSSPRGSAECWQHQLCSAAAVTPQGATIPALTLPHSLPPPFFGHYGCPLFLQTLTLLL